MTTETQSSDSLGSGIRHAEGMMAKRSFLEAIDCWKHLIATFPACPAGAYVRLASAYLDSGCPEQARASIEQCLKVHPDLDMALEFQKTIESRSRFLYQVNLARIGSAGPHAAIESKLKPIQYQNLSQFRLKGWVAHQKDAPSRLVLQLSNGLVVRLAFNDVRMDVIQELEKKEELGYEPQCGFDHVVNIFNVAKLGIESTGGSQWIYEINTQLTLQVLRGRDDWLFLDNDTNRSVDLFTGRLVLSEDQLQAYRAYADKLQALRQRVKLCFLVSPSKESVLPQYHPSQRGALTVIDQVSSLPGIGGEGFFLYPVELLASQDGAYCKTDTHWTQAGAYAAVKGCLRAFGLNLDTDALFNATDAMTAGDLGSKLETPERSPYRLISPSRDTSQVVFRSHTPRNLGRTLLYRNEHAPVAGKLMIFGSSFSERFYHLFACIFQEVIFMYSPATPVLELIEHEKAEFVLLETAERFLIHPPRFIDDIEHSPLSEAVQALSPAERKMVLQSIEGEKDRGNVYYEIMKRKLCPESAAPSNPQAAPLPS